MDSVSLLSSLPPAGKLNGRNPLKAIALASSAVSASACMISLRTEGRPYSC
ncbi:MAG: hypothetical protein ACTS40_01130 [Candidatus Hodgkinia cicadicola]